MRYLDEPTVPSSKKSKRNTDSRSVEAQNIDIAISLFGNIVETACEQESGLDLMRLINLMDLYRVYLQMANSDKCELHPYLASISQRSEAVVTQKLGNTSLISFERFVRDSRLLNLTARAATKESGETVLAPAPLMVSANS